MKYRNVIREHKIYKTLQQSTKQLLNCGYNVVIVNNSKIRNNNNKKQQNLIKYIFDFGEPGISGNMLKIGSS